MVTQIIEQTSISGASMALRSLPPQAQRRLPPVHDESTLQLLFETEREAKYERSSRIKALWLTCCPQIPKEIAQYLIGDARKIYDVLLAIVRTKGISSRVEPKAIKVYEFYDPEESSRQLVLQVEIKANVAAALAYWDAVGVAIDDWRENLPVTLRDKVTEQWSMRIFW